VTQAQSEHLPNAPFAIDAPKGFDTPLSVTTHDLWHRFYQNQMQIDGGKNDRFVAGPSGALDFNDLTIARTPATRDYSLPFGPFVLS
jgi:phospholipase C